MTYHGKQYANLSAGAWRSERAGVVDRADWSAAQQAELGAFLARHGEERHSLSQWDLIWDRATGDVAEERAKERAGLVPPGKVRCHAASDGDCDWAHCPQLRDGEPKATGRHCPNDEERSKR